MLGLPKEEEACRLQSERRNEPSWLRLQSSQPQEGAVQVQQARENCVIGQY
jgi:hypothetical protein